MTTIHDYGPLFRAAYGALHGGRANEPQLGEDEPGSEIAQALERLQGRLAAVTPPRRLRDAHDALARLLAAAIEADRELALQVGAYARGEMEASLHHSERVASLVIESVRLDRDLVLALRSAEESRPGTLAALGLAEVPEPPIAAEDAEDWV